MSRRSPGRGTERRRGRFAACASLLALISAQAASGQPARPGPSCPDHPNWSAYPAMRFTVQQLEGRPVLLAEGGIDEEMLPRLEQALAGFRGNEIWLRSPGGNARVGNMAGRMIRARNLATRVPPGWACSSACAFMFMGGIARSVNPGGVLIVQMFTHGLDRHAIDRELALRGGSADRLLGDIAQDSVMTATQDADYLIQMGVSRRLLSDIIYRTRAFEADGRPAPPRCLTAEEMRRYGVVTTGDAAPGPGAPAK